MSEFTMIRIKKTTHKRLTECGQKGDTYDDIIQKLLNKETQR